MNIGIFTDTYFPQVSGVATSIQTLKEQLENKGHSVYIFTTTDPRVPEDAVEPNVFRFGSVAFVSFKDRRIAVRGLFQALEVAKNLKLDIVHTQTEFSIGYIGKFVARSLHIPTVHTYHTMYEDYLHYVMNGHLLKPYHVRQMTRAFLHHDAGVIAPTDRVLETLAGYGVSSPIRVIATGVNLESFAKTPVRDVRAELGLSDVPVLISLSRVAFEKRIDKVIDAMPRIIKSVPDAVLLVVGDGPARASLEEQAETLDIADHVRFIGEVRHEEVPLYYHAADIFLSASDSEAQGLTYLEAMAAGTKVLALSGEYTDTLLNDPSLGRTFSTPSEMAAQAIDYCTHPEAYSENGAREAKLRNISAREFGERVLKMYNDASVYYEQVLAPQFAEHTVTRPLRFRRVKRKEIE